MTNINKNQPLIFEQNEDRSNLLIPQMISKVGSKQQKNLQKGKKWSFEENVLYCRFLKLNSNKFQVNDGDKKFRKYKKMSLFLLSRTPKQCRTHHQKMMIKFINVQSIVNSIMSQHNDYTSTKLTSIENSNQQINQFNEIQKNYSSIESYENKQYNSQQNLLQRNSNDFIYDILF